MEFLVCKINLKLHSEEEALMRIEARSKVRKQADLKNWKLPDKTKLICGFMWVLFSFCFE